MHQPQNQQEQRPARRGWSQEKKNTTKSDVDAACKCMRREHEASGTACVGVLAPRVVVLPRFDAS